jgi:hypothetical protein
MNIAYRTNKERKCKAIYLANGIYKFSLIFFFAQSMSPDISDYNYTHQTKKKRMRIMYTQ